jgi:antitoxin component YwqK of YwqJK toxin-antitoxin module
MRIFILSVTILFLVACKYSTKAVTYYPNGALKTEVEISKGKKNGIAKVYFEDGVLEQEGLWVND